MEPLRHPRYDCSVSTERDFTPEHVRRNRARWDANSAEYQRKNAPLLDLPFLGWGLWHQPESELQVLGDVRGKDVLELGCGGAQWSIGLAHEGARRTANGSACSAGTASSSKT